eukprot:c21675_g1_i3.p1 GENE.c21675_g1_i3~~c21675_g1_i3.p1  ORF type:complete len:595 (-),score=157.72 c21675_g1_i3:23-1636(-)
MWSFFKSPSQIFLSNLQTLCEDILQLKNQPNCYLSSSPPKIFVKGVTKPNNIKFIDEFVKSNRFVPPMEYFQLLLENFVITKNLDISSCFERMKDRKHDAVEEFMKKQEFPQNKILFIKLFQANELNDDILRGIVFTQLAKCAKQDEQIDEIEDIIQEQKKQEILWEFFKAVLIHRQKTGTHVQEKQINLEQKLQGLEQEKNYLLDLNEQLTNENKSLKKELTANNQKITKLENDFQKLNQKSYRNNQNKETTPEPIQSTTQNIQIPTQKQNLEIQAEENQKLKEKTEKLEKENFTQSISIQELQKEIETIKSNLHQRNNISTEIPSINELKASWEQIPYSNFRSFFQVNESNELKNRLKFAFKYINIYYSQFQTYFLNEKQEMKKKLEELGIIDQSKLSTLIDTIISQNWKKILEKMENQIRDEFIKHYSSNNNHSSLRCFQDLEEKSKLLRRNLFIVILNPTVKLNQPPELYYTPFSNKRHISVSEYDDNGLNCVEILGSLSYSSISATSSSSSHNNDELIAKAVVWCFDSEFQK